MSGGYGNGYQLVTNALQDAYDQKVAKMDPEYPFAETLQEQVEDMIDDGVFSFEIDMPIDATDSFRNGVDEAKADIQSIASAYRGERGIAFTRTETIEF